MKKIIFLLCACITINVYSQSLSDLEKEPAFKGISIGSPISRYSNFLQFQKTEGEKTSYIITDPQYLSIFNIKMTKGLVIAKDGKVEAILLAKDYTPGIFNPKELEVLRSSLSFKYGSPNVNIDDFTGTPIVAGVRWNASTVVLDIAYLFYGTDMPGSGLRYLLYKRNDDY